MGVYACGMTSFEQLLQHGTTSAWLFLPTAVVLGALHGLEPGHSKTMMAAFIVSIRGTIGQALLLGLSATISHTAIIWILAYAGLRYAAKLDVEKSEPYFQLASGVIILILAAWTFVRTRREKMEEAAHSHSHAHPHEHGPAGEGPNGGQLIDTGGHGEIEITVFEDDVPPCFRLFFFEQGNRTAAILPAEQTVTLETVRPDGNRHTFAFKPAITSGSYLESTTEIPEPHEFTAYVQVGHGGHAHTYKTEFTEEGHHHDHGGSHSHGDHAHGADHQDTLEYQDAHARAHAADLERRFAGSTVTTPQIVLFGLTGGLLPCPAAFSVLLVCLQVKRYTLGFATVLAFSVGLAFTLVSAGVVAAISVRQAGKRFKGFDRMLGGLPYLSVGVMTAIGLFIAVTGLRGMMH